ncbi:N-acetyltransferase family protein [Streptomyces sp. NPDC050636]|uniref:GNAT family N-acetyltransferase n=1 Tax=Streptomyces sp. NPDC050636 TaxID=3154510 RepID=UPI003421D78F
MPLERGEVLVRAGVEADLPALTELYNHYIRETSITFDREPYTPEQRRPWLLSHPEDGPHRLLVARETTAGAGAADNAALDDTSLLGYATSSAFRPKGAYATSVEVTVYCAPHAGGRGVGTLLYEALFEALAKEDVHRAYAGITQPNGGGTSLLLKSLGDSGRLHARFGFRHIGTFTEVGRKFGRYWDVAWHQKDLTRD